MDFDKAYSATGDVMPLKSFATSLIPTVTAHFKHGEGDEDLYWGIARPIVEFMPEVAS